jgi:LysM repeat protein
MRFKDDGFRDEFSDAATESAAAFGDEYGFWADAPTVQLRRVRRHHHQQGPRADGNDRDRAVGQVHVARDAEPTRLLRRIDLASRPSTVARPLVPRNGEPILGRPDPVLMRVGAAVLALVLLVPAVNLLRGGGDGGATLQAATSAPATAAPPAGVIAVPRGVVPIVPSGESTGGAAAPVQAVSAAEQAASSGGGVAQAQVAPASQATKAMAPASQPAASAPAAVSSQTLASPPANSAASAAASANSSAPARVSCAKKYTVVKGDYWILIARKHSVTLREVLRANNAKTSTPLFPGRTVCLPANASPATTVPPTTKPPTTKPPTTKPPVTTQPPATTKPPVVTQPPATTRPPNTYTKDQVKQIIRDVWPDDLEDEAIRIATRESNLTPNVRNYCCFGLFQIYFNVHKSWLKDIGITSAEQLYDPKVNALAAFVLYKRAGGWGPWKL